MTVGPILVTGGNGQVAQALGRLAPDRDMDVVVLGRPGFDFDRPESLTATVASRWSRVLCSGKNNVGRNHRPNVTH